MAGRQHGGISDPSVVDDASMFVLNAATAGTDLVAVALAFIHAWGQRCRRGW